jgi:hypothetical protein
MWFLPASWITGVFVPDGMQLVMPAADPTKSTKVQLLGNHLVSYIQQNYFEPNKPVWGWVLIDMPPAYDKTTHPRTFRISVKDAAGNQYSTTLTDSDFGSAVTRSANFEILGNEPRVDLTGYSVSHWAN